MSFSPALLFHSRNPTARTTFVRLALLALILCAYGWRVSGLTRQSLWRDEVDAIYFALRDLPDTLAMFVAMAQNGPLYFLTLRLWFYFVGASEFALRYPSVIAGTLAIPLTWLVAQRLMIALPPTRAEAAVPDEAHRDIPVNRTGLLTATTLPLLAALLLAVNPYQLWYGQEGKMYAIITVLTLLAHWLWLQGIRRGGWRIWGGYCLVVSCAIYTHLLMIMLIPLHMLWFLLAWPQSKAHWRGYGGALAGLTLPYLPLLVWQWPMLLANEAKTGFNFVPLSKMIESLAMSHNNGLLPPAPWLNLLPMLFLALVGMLLGGGAIQAVTAALPAGAMESASSTLGSWRRHALLLCWLIFPVLMIYGLSLRQPVYTDRYVIWIAPALMMLMALGARTIRDNAGPLATPLVVVLLLYTIGFWGYRGWLETTTTIKYDLRDGVTYVAERRDPSTLLILQIPHQQWAWQYYTGDNSFDLFATGPARLGNWAEGLWTNGGEFDAEATAVVDEQMRAITSASSEVWLLSSEVEMWDARHLMRAWLDNHAALIEQAEFH
ncbi:MAG TPA: hypothetical protein P5121_18850, partial [Caldilineaceae bacterium]|nr:hypothetical protein [Caldilineaceae bacterium]